MNYDNYDIAIIGSGPAGLCAAIESANKGAKVLLIERDGGLGGQLTKQTHKFFGSKGQYASTRGIDIATILIDEAMAQKNITIMTNATALGIYRDGVITVEHENKYKKIKPQIMIVATGASEKFLTFKNNDLPGIYGAGAIQTLMNSYGIKPADEVVMLGAGNIGLIVSYQLIQAGVKVKAIMCGGPVIGGYLVHASKLRRMGVPILTNHSIERANGTDKLESVTVIRLDDKYQKIEGTEFDIKCDNLCISAGLSPLTELLWQIGCKMKFVPELGGHVALRSKDLETSVKNVFIAGDISAVEEASAAMVQGRIVGIVAAKRAGYNQKGDDERRAGFSAELAALRSGEAGAKLRKGIEKVEVL